VLLEAAGITPAAGPAGGGSKSEPVGGLLGGQRASGRQVRSGEALARAVKVHFRLYSAVGLCLNWPVNAAVAGDVLLDVVEQHAEELAFCWTFRDAAAHSPAYDLLELCELDDRLEAHLDGLRIAGEVGWQLCEGALDDAEDGEIFAAAVVALDQQRLKGFAKVIDLAALEPELLRAMIAALGWLPFEKIEQVGRALLQPNVPSPLLHLGIACHAIHRRDPGGMLITALGSDDARLRSRALRAVGELGRTDLAATARYSLSDDDDEACRFWACWSLALLGRRGVLDDLRRIAESDSGFAARACDLAVRLMDPTDACRWLESLAPRGEHSARVALRGAAALGDPKLVPGLFAFFQSDDYARLAAGALSLITNANITDDFEGSAPEGFEGGPTDDADDEDVEMDPDEDWPWPDVPAVEAWWAEHRAGFQPHTRYLLGQPLSADWLAHVLRHGNQVARASASLELALQKPGKGTFETRAPGFYQLQTLTGRKA